MSDRAQGALLIGRSPALTERKLDREDPDDPVNQPACDQARSREPFERPALRDLGADSARGRPSESAVTPDAILCSSFVGIRASTDLPGGAERNALSSAVASTNEPARRWMPNQRKGPAKELRRPSKRTIERGRAARFSLRVPPWPATKTRNACSVLGSAAISSARRSLPGRGSRTHRRPLAGTRCRRFGT